MVNMYRLIPLALLAAATAVAQESHDLGYDDTPYYPGSKWRVHDSTRRRPEVVTHGSCNSPTLKPPSDAEVLFDGHDVSKWEPLKWKVENGYMQIVPGQGGAVTKEKF